MANKKGINNKPDKNQRDRENKMDRKEVREQMYPQQRGVDRKGGGKTEAARRKARKGK